MAEGAGNIIVNVVANTQPFIKGMNEAKSATHTFNINIKQAASQARQDFSAMSGASDAFKSTLSQLKTAAIGYLGFSGIAGVVRLVVTEMQRLNELSDMAINLGMDTTSLGRMQQASQLAGVQAGELESAMMKMVNAIGEGSESLAKLGLDFEQLRKIGPEQQFLAIADAISKLPTKAERAAASQDIFGKTGGRMQQFIEGGTAGIVGRMADVPGLGVTDEEIQRINESKAKVDKLGMSWQALKSSMALAAADSFSWFGRVSTDAAWWLDEKMGGKGRAGAAQAEDLRAASQREWLKQLEMQQQRMKAESTATKSEPLGLSQMAGLNAAIAGFIASQRTFDEDRRQVGGPVGAGAAALRGSQDANAILRNFENQFSHDSDEQLRLQREQTDSLRRIEENTRNTEILNIG